jgi:hypothetical protein
MPFSRVVARWLTIDGNSGDICDRRTIEKHLVNSDRAIKLLSRAPFNSDVFYS